MNYNQEETVQHNEPSKVKCLVQRVLGLDVNFYVPVITDLEHRKFDYINIEDNGNIVRLGNSKEEFTFYDFKFTESFVGFYESLKSGITRATMTFNAGTDDVPACTEVCITVSDEEPRWGGGESLSFSWLSDNVKLTYVPKENK